MIQVLTLPKEYMTELVLRKARFLIGFSVSAYMYSLYLYLYSADLFIISGVGILLTEIKHDIWVKI